MRKRGVMRNYSIVQPDLTLQNNLMAFGFMCEKGWHELIIELLDKLQKIENREHLGMTITEIKEKYGELRVYISHGTDEMFELIDWYTEKSKTVCEICGEPGKLHKVKGWLMTRCNNCLRKESEEE